MWNREIFISRSKGNILWAASWHGKNLVCSEQRKAEQFPLHFLCPLSGKSRASPSRGQRCPSSWGHGVAPSVPSRAGSGAPLEALCCWKCVWASLADPWGYGYSEESKRYLVRKYMYAHLCSHTCEHVCTQAFMHMWVCIYMPTYTNLILHLATLFLVLQGDFYVYF